MNYVFHIENNLIIIKGATKIISSTPSQAIIETGECGIVITGNNIEVKSLNLEENEVCISGQASNIKFSSSVKKQPFLKRIFK